MRKQSLADSNKVELLATVDSSKTDAGNKKGVITPSTQFLIYKPVHLSGESIADSLKDIGAQLKQEQIADPGLLQALASMKWVQSTQSLLFTGNPDSLKKVQTLIATIDDANQAQVAKTFFQYHKDINVVFLYSLLIE